ncbi:unnamed protein product [Moneuplotes crassus]|uniref:Uncharacterized protein n=1 Tax=Euplotes crassus TaxID=5936 RepID=A0AAD2D5R6_EUPCR|nr:unnamed protein product [Moneuplotes crassus]
MIEKIKEEIERVRKSSHAEFYIESHCYSHLSKITANFHHQQSLYGLQYMKPPECLEITPGCISDDIYCVLHSGRRESLPEVVSYSNAVGTECMDYSSGIDSIRRLQFVRFRTYKQDVGWKIWALMFQTLQASKNNEVFVKAYTIEDMKNPMFFSRIRKVWNWFDICDELGFSKPSYATTNRANNTFKHSGFILDQNDVESFGYLEHSDLDFNIEPLSGCKISYFQTLRSNLFAKKNQIVSQKSRNLPIKEPIFKVSKNSNTSYRLKKRSQILISKSLTSKTTILNKDLQDVKISVIKKPNKKQADLHRNIVQPGIQEAIPRVYSRNCQGLPSQTSSIPRSVQKSPLHSNKHRLSKLSNNSVRSKPKVDNIRKRSSQVWYGKAIQQKMLPSKFGAETSVVKTTLEMGHVKKNVYWINKKYDSQEEFNKYKQSTSFRSDRKIVVDPIKKSTRQDRITKLAKSLKFGTQRYQNQDASPYINLKSKIFGLFKNAKIQSLKNGKASKSCSKREQDLFLEAACLSRNMKRYDLGFFNKRKAKSNSISVER